MMPEQLLSAVRARLDEIERVAQAAAGSGGEFDWRADGDEVLTVDGMVVVSGRPTEHIALHDPAAVLRRATADRRVLKRHAFSVYRHYRTGQWLCDYCSDLEPEIWPCPDFADLADRSGIRIDSEESRK